MAGKRKLRLSAYAAIVRKYKAGWKQSALAAYYRVSQQHISRIVRGIRR
jgi:transcriptional regulator with XRE-family HTH domain